MLLRRWLRQHPDSPMAQQTRDWVVKNTRQTDILRGL